MQDEVNEKTVSLCIRCGKVTANLLKAAMVKALAKMEQEKNSRDRKQTRSSPRRKRRIRPTRENRALIS